MTLDKLIDSHKLISQQQVSQQQVSQQQVNQQQASQQQAFPSLNMNLDSDAKEPSRNGRKSIDSIDSIDRQYKDGRHSEDSIDRQYKDGRHSEDSIDRQYKDGRHSEDSIDRQGKDNNNLLVAGSLHPKRKRGLSLRTQLFNKAFNIQTEPYPPQSETNQPQLQPQPQPQPQLTPVHNVAFEAQNEIELENISKNRFFMPPPAINIEKSPEPISVNSKAINYDLPYITVDAHLTKSSTHLTADSMKTNTSTNSFLAKRQRLHRVPRNAFIRKVVDLKNKILGIKCLPSTECGRIIPLSVNPESVNEYYQDEYYLPKLKGFIDERTNQPYVSNLITSSKYTIYTFLPKQLRAQFSKIANCYFMVVAIMQMIPGWSTTGHYTTIIPLCIFISISIAREGFDDWKRHGHDKEENNKLTTVVREDTEFSNFDAQSINTIMTETIPVVPGQSLLKSHHLQVQLTVSKNSSLSDIGDSLTQENLSFTNKEAIRSYNLKECPTKWKNVKVGDIVKINENEWFPADVILIGTSNKQTQEAFVETMALDGETNLKPKVPHREISKRASTVPGLKNLRTLVTTEDPNIDLYNFEASFQIEDTVYPLGSENVVYRGSILRNTESVLGLVVFTGEETKIRMNNIKNPRTKAPKLQKNINYIVSFMVFVVIMLSAFSTMAQRIKLNETRNKAWYLQGQDAGVAATLMGFIIMYNTLIPLSLYVTMEIIKVMQLCFLQFDIDMYHKESNTPADAKTATILEELGQVSYIFSDKTGTLTDNKMIFRKFSVCGVSWLHDLDLMLNERAEPGNTDIQPLIPRTSLHYIPLSLSQQHTSLAKKTPEDKTNGVSARISTTSLVRESMDVGQSGLSAKTWVSTAQPHKVQDTLNSIQLLRYLQSHPQTLFSKKAKFFLLSLAICNTCLPRKIEKKESRQRVNDSCSSLEEVAENQEVLDDASITYQAASPDELALVQAARDLGYVVFDRQTDKLIIKTYPNGFNEEAILEEYQILDVIEFSSVRKRMSVIVRFPDGRICLICKGADNIILEKLKNSKLAKVKAKEISAQSAERKMEEADVILQSRFSQDLESRKSGLSMRQSFNISSAVSNRMNTIDNALMGVQEEEIEDIAERARKSLHLQQAKRYTFELNGSELESGEDLETTNNQNNHHRMRAVTATTATAATAATNVHFIPNDKLLVNEEFLIEKTLEHIEEYSTEGLRTLLYSFKWLDKKDYEAWHNEYTAAKTELTDRAKLVETIGGKIENNLELVGATAIEDKLQDGVSEAIVKLRRAGIKLWMLTGDKRETAINIGYSCQLIKDYSTVVILSNDDEQSVIIDLINSTLKDIQGGRVAHCVLVIDGSTLADVEANPQLLSNFLNLCVEVDSTICCRASPSQKASMVSAVRHLKSEAVTLAIGDGANDIAMIQSADIGVGVTGKEGLQAARSADYAIAQFRFLLKLLLVNGRYNYVRTSKFVLCTFYKELIFYLTQCIFQRNTLFSGSSMYESWSLSMFNTLFTSLPVICIGMFDKDLKPATLLAVPELYSKGRLYQAFNLKVFISWMVLATLQSIGICFLAFYCWGSTALRDNTVFALGSLMFGALVIIINAKCVLLEMQNRQWLAFASFIISVGGFGLWNVLIMFLYRSKESTIFFVAYGLFEWGRDQSWWAALLLFSTIPLLFDIFIKIFKFMFKPNDDEIFRVYEQDIELRRFFENTAYKELFQSWTFPRDQSTTKASFIKLFKKIGLCRGSSSSSSSNNNNNNNNNNSNSNSNMNVNTNTNSNNSSRLELDIEMNEMNDNRNTNDPNTQSSINRKRAGTNPMEHELPSSGEGYKMYGNDYSRSVDSDGYETLPSGKRVRIKKRKSRISKWSLSKAFGVSDDDDDVDAIIDARLRNLRAEEEGN
ncbi:DNF3 [Candida oxycetoniae]|uniref:P-type phospholipid transporter n=1 Tax=Candida oxycetoniae TaxID=497107 RepID=A0AAI9T1R3_9ASCO|nr:DNF3 [Candida oxycetoniae]KAI3406706.2 DNF3 [Candida oxycetoniae]